MVGLSVVAICAFLYKKRDTLLWLLAGKRTHTRSSQDTAWARTRTRSRHHCRPSFARHRTRLPFASLASLAVCRAHFYRLNITKLLLLLLKRQRFTY